MKKNLSSLIVTLAILFSANLTRAQRTLNESKLQINLSDSVWFESSINIEIRKHGDLGFFDSNDLHGNNDKALAIFRTYRYINK